MTTRIQPDTELPVVDQQHLALRMKNETRRGPLLGQTRIHGVHANLPLSVGVDEAYHLVHVVTRERRVNGNGGYAVQQLLAIETRPAELLHRREVVQAAAAIALDVRRNAVIIQVGDEAAVVGEARAQGEEVVVVLPSLDPRELPHGRMLELGQEPLRVLAARLQLPIQVLDPVGTERGGERAQLEVQAEVASVEVAKPAVIPAAL